MPTGKREIVDAHHHLWDLGICRYPWLMARGEKRFFGDPAPIQRNYLIEEFQDDASDYDLTASVHVQVGVAKDDELEETRWLQRIADRQGLPSAIVAFCDLAEEWASLKLDQQCKFSALRGIRQIIGRSNEEDAVTGSGRLLENRTWLNNLAVLPEFELSFDLQLVPGQMPRVAEILSRMPELRVALCHCGSPWDQSPAGLNTWREGLTRLASLPNVYCKLSGFGMFDRNWTAASIRPLIESCVVIFGAERCMFGSNFPVDKLHATYRRVWGAYEEIVADCSATEQAGLFGGTAKKFYRL